MKTIESDLEKKCRKIARVKGWVAMKLEKNGHKGVPDDIFLLPHTNRCFLVEFKASATSHVRDEQKIWQEMFDTNCYLIHSEEDFELTIKKENDKVP